MSKKKIKIQSLSTPGHNMFVRSWLAELVMTRANKGQKLKPYFWRDSRWKWKYTSEVKAVSKFIKKYGEAAVVKVVSENRKIFTFASYGEMEVLLQKEHGRIERLLLPKDNTEVTSEEPEVVTDLRGPRLSISKKGLFQRLAELENDTNV